jgi:putative ABC transport system permease protein
MSQTQLDFSGLAFYAVLFYRFILRHLLGQPLRSVLTVLGIMLGVGILLAMNLANQTVLSHFKETVNLVSGKAALVVRSDSMPELDERTIQKLFWVRALGVEIQPVLEGTVTRQGKVPEVIQVLGLNLLDPRVYAQYGVLISPRPNDGEGEVSGMNMALFSRGHGILGEKLKNNMDGLNVWVNETSTSIQPVGFLEKEGLGKAYSGQLILMDLAVAQDFLGQNGKVTRLDLILPPWVSVEPLKGLLQNAVPDGVTVERPTQRGEQVEKMVRSFQSNLTAVSFIALLVGMFLIYNTMSVSVLRRRPEIGILRALGLPSRGIFLLFVGEALTLGVVGSLLGIGLGLLLAKGALASVSQTVEALYLSQSATEIQITWPEMLVAFLLGIGMTLLGALPPVWEATQVPPAEATRRRSEEIQAVQIAPFWGLLGLVCLGISVWAALQPPVGELPLFGYFSALMVVLGAALLSPFVMGWILDAFAKVFQRQGALIPLLSVLNLKGALGRSAVAVASLMVGIAMMVSLALMIFSFRGTVIDWVNQSFRAEILAKPASRMTGKVTGKLAPEVIQKIQASPDVMATGEFYEFPMVYQGSPTHLGIWNTEVLLKYGDLTFLDGSSMEVVQKRLETKPSVFVTESFAVRQGLKTGDQVVLSTPTGKKTLPIQGVFYDYTSDQGYIILPRHLYRQYYQDDAVSDLAIFLKPGLDPEVARTKLVSRLGENHQVLMTTQSEVKAEVLRIFDQTFSITYALHAIAIVVAVLGIMNTLFAQVLESRRDFGILRYVGASRLQIRQMVLIQAAILAFSGCMAGFLLGGALSILLIEVINKQSFGWSVRFAMDGWFILEAFVLVMATALISALLPARVAETFPLAEVIRTE